MSETGDSQQVIQKEPLEPFIVVGPIVSSTKLDKISILEDNLILVKNGKVASIQSASHLAELQSELGLGESQVLHLNPGEFVMPGLVDTHIHAPQYPNAGLGYDKTLLDWLTEYTYPLEGRYGDVQFARNVYETVVRHSVACGTTTACYFATIHLESSVILSDVIEKVGQRGLVGKVNMNLNTPPGYGESTEQSLADTESFIQNLQGRGNDLIMPVITPRFALSCDMELMKQLGVLAQKYDVHIQTHISENASEVEAVKELYPQCRNYADVYDKAALLTKKTVLAHGVLLKDEEVHVLATRGTAVSHCPNSNTSLRSGLCDVRRLLTAGVKVGLGTDVSGGYSVSILDAMHNALTTAVHLSFMKEGLQPLNYHEVFYLATLGGAEALALDHKIGNFALGKDFDALVINMNPASAPGDLLGDTDINHLVQKFVYTADDRNIVKTFVAGRQI